MKIFLSILVMSVLLSATEFHTVFQKKIFLDKNTTGELVLQEESFQTLAEEPAKILINYEVNGTKKEYLFRDSSKKFPILYFDKPTYNTKIDESVNLVNSVNIFDIDSDGTNEMFLYGTSHYGGSGLVGKLLVLKKNKRGNVAKIGIIEAHDNFEMHYIKEENIIVAAQYIWRQGIEGHYGDTHRYKLDVYTLNDRLKKIPIYITEKKYNDQNSSIIDDNLEIVLAKYRIYNKNHISQEEQTKYRNFVQNYWDKVSQKDFEFIKQVFSDTAYYYTKRLNKEDILKDKKSVLKNIKKMTFDLNDFFIYKEKETIKIEYLKTYDIEGSMDGGTVKSLMVLEKVGNKLLITNESDPMILYQQKDLD